ncbi:MAG: DUF3043 domain-containing protein [Pseudoclavibacter sp.]|nr:DUF3043 domain-containing protein [Pseudoclavibacter sp.]
MTQRDQRDPGAKKSRPTPKRREREAANRRPLVPEDRKLAKRENQERVRAERQRYREGYARGDDQYLRPGDRGPQKRFLRDFVDARFTIGELAMPVLLLVLLASFVVPNDPRFVSTGMLVAYCLIAASVLEGIVLGRIVKRRIAAVVGRDRVERGIPLAAVLRVLQLRFLRMPKPRVRRGQKVVFTGR